MNRALSILALSALAACGGGGSGGESPAPSYDSTPALVLQKDMGPNPKPTNSNCVQVANEVACEMWQGDIGAGIPPGTYAKFTNNTGTYLQVDAIDAYTGERRYWSEFCAYKIEQPGDFITGQLRAGAGEAGCSAKMIGDDYAPITWGATTGLSVAPGQSIIVGSHTEPASINHTYTLRVRQQTAGLHSWRQPQIDQVNDCDGNVLSTKWSPWRNDTGRRLVMSGAEVYAISANPSMPNTVTAACVHVLDVSGNVRWSNCGLASRGSVNWPAVEIQPGESVAAQASNSCKAPAVWGWAAFLRVW